MGSQGCFGEDEYLNQRTCITLRIRTIYELTNKVLKGNIMKKKSLAVVLLVVLSLLAFRWWKGTGDDPRLLRTIDSSTTSEFGVVDELIVNSDGSKFAHGIGNHQHNDELIIWDSRGFVSERFAKTSKLFRRAKFEPIDCIAFSPNWHKFAYAQPSSKTYNSLNVFDLVEGTVSSIRPEFLAVDTVTFDLQGNRIAFLTNRIKTEDAPGGNGIFIHWTDGSGKLVTLDGVPERKTISHIAFSPDKDRLVARDRGGNVYMWNLVDEQLVFVLELDVQYPQQDTFLFSPDSKRFVVFERGIEGNEMQLRSSVDGTIEEKISLPFGSEVLGISPDWKWYAAKNLRDELNIHNLKSGELLYSLRGHTKEIHDASFSGDSRRLVSIAYDRTFKIWDLTK